MKKLKKESDGSFVKSLRNWNTNMIVYTCEILEGKDFFDFKEKVDWIITNPPYSKMRKFIQHSMEVSDNIVFLTTINHLWLKARIRDIKQANFGIKEIILLDTPKNFPQSGFQIGCFHLQKDYIGDIKFSSYLKDFAKEKEELNYSLDKLNAKEGK